MKMRLLAHIFMVGTSLAMLGCGASLPDCGDPKATELIKQILVENAGKKAIEGLSVSQVTVESIETLHKDDKLEKNQCAATIKWALRPQTSKLLALLSADGLMANDKQSIGSGQALAIGAAMQAIDNPQILASYQKGSEYKDLLARLALTFNGLLEKSEVALASGVISLSKAKIGYTIRKSEDKNSKNELMVEIGIPPDSLNVITEFEMLPGYEQRGKKYMETAGAGTSQEVKQTPDMQAPTATVPSNSGQAPAN